MLCKDCGQPVDGEYRFMRTVAGNVCQCFNCGHKDFEWSERLAYDEDRLRNKRRDYMQHSPEILLQRIKDAFYEGYSSPQFDRYYEETTNVDEEWENSEAKEVYDTLTQFWGL